MQTPEEDSGVPNTSFLFDALRSLLKSTQENTIICIKSTSPPEFIHELEEVDIDTQSILFNPEFLREGSALEDFFDPDRIVIDLFQRQNSKSKIQKDKKSETFKTNWIKEKNIYQLI